ncbi:hypothetical protein HBI40_103690 [Parastagonospora nodorum]|nr:hypothetical protein HBH46_158200 [Parastagonospora nodorum]KAH5327724.1 hypothetical protein HBI50_076910 [Parastagonospora nodorum]KAH5693902.1 hypothetical protein HBI44_142060 [Parastagonospora nodorum]KAH6002997.1 hypothetical protein HBI84_080490 [Parastagonospora nodorum]KAH6288203.1 hypothetical protein HBI40_103690 [Parastagonospora nodorum]
MAAALVTQQALQLLQVPTPFKPSYEALRYLMFRLISTGCRPDIPWRDDEYYPKPPGVGYTTPRTRGFALVDYR